MRFEVVPHAEDERLATLHCQREGTELRAKLSYRDRPAGAVVRTRFLQLHKAAVHRAQSTFAKRHGVRLRNRVFGGGTMTKQIIGQQGKKGGSARCLLAYRPLHCEAETIREAACRGCMGGS
jgi:hypothetical protein